MRNLTCQLAEPFEGMFCLGRNESKIGIDHFKRLRASGRFPGPRRHQCVARKALAAEFWIQGERARVSISNQCLHGTWTVDEGQHALHVVPMYWSHGKRVVGCSLVYDQNFTGNGPICTCLSL